MLTLAQMALRAGAPLLPLGRHVPFIMQRLVIEQALARCFAQPLREGEFDLLAGKWLHLHITDLDMSWYLTRIPDRLQVARQAKADVSIRGSWRDFLLLASRQEDPDTLFFRRRLIIEGDTELGLAIKNLMDSLDPEQLPPRLWHLIDSLGRAAQQSAAQPGMTMAHRS